MSKKEDETEVRIWPGPQQWRPDIQSVVKVVFYPKVTRHLCAPHFIFNKTGKDMTGFTFSKDYSTKTGMDSTRHGHEGKKSVAEGRPVQIQRDLRGTIIQCNA